MIFVIRTKIIELEIIMLDFVQVVAMVGECKCRTNKLTIRIERSGKYIVRGGRIKDKKIIHARVCTATS